MAEYDRPILTADVACFTLINQQLHILLSQRTSAPYEGKLALPGGYVHVDQDANIEATAKRIARDKLSLDVNYMEQLQTFSGNARDPRGWSASVVYLAMLTPTKLRENHREFYPIGDGSLHGLPELAFDHNVIITAALQRLRNKTTFSTLPMFLMPPKFTLYDLQRVYEAVTGTSRFKSSFRRHVIDQGIVEPTGEVQQTALHRPAELYRRTARTLKVFDRGI